jgi:hypothetical protein
MIMIAILAVVGVAAVRLGSVERTNAAAKGKRDLLVACAHAARIAVWTQITRGGAGYMQATDLPVAIILPDGTELMSPAALTGSAKDGSPIMDLVDIVQIHSAETTATRDITNTMSGSRVPPGMGYRFLARCRDPKGRELAVELGLKFAL